MHSCNTFELLAHSFDLKKKVINYFATEGGPAVTGKWKGIHSFHYAFYMKNRVPNDLGVGGILLRRGQQRWLFFLIFTVLKFRFIR